MRRRTPGAVPRETNQWAMQDSNIAKIPRKRRVFLKAVQKAVQFRAMPLWEIATWSA